MTDIAQGHQKSNERLQKQLEDCKQYNQKIKADLYDRSEIVKAAQRMLEAQTEASHMQEQRVDT